MLRYGSIRLGGIFCPSFSQVYLRGVVPFALHFNLIVCDAGHALNALFNIFGSEKVGAPETGRVRERVNRVGDSIL